MDSIRLTLPDGTVAEVPRGTPARALLDHLPASVREQALAVAVDGKVLDLDRPLEEGGELRVLTFADEAGREVFRHTSTHVMAQAVKRLFPEARLATGPPLPEGFYYDIQLERPLGEADLSAIEEEMARIVREDLPIVREVWDRERALRYFAERGEAFKVEIIREIPPEETLSVYRQGEFVDLCRGPHLPSTGKIGAFKVLHVAGAYWRGDETRPMLSRLYGTSFPTQEELDRYLWRQEEAKKRDHRRLGRELGLFTFQEEAPGFAFWLPGGVVVYRELENLSRSLQARLGYQEVATPWIFSARLWERSGHLAHYRDHMFLMQLDGEEMGLKPMNCPGHCLIYRSRTRSYRDLPLRLAEYGPLSRFERSGTLHGLLRVRGFHQDDAHLFVREDQIEAEMAHVLSLVDEIYRTFGMAYTVRLSTRPEDAMGDPALWDRAEAALARALDNSGRPYTVNPGDGAFYGPKLDFYVTDALDRSWQCATVQLDFQLPLQFDLTYTDADGRERRPVMIHRAVFGSIERFVGILTEHFAGAFPTWLAPVQVRVLPIADRHHPYAERVLQVLRDLGVRAEVDARPDKVGYKIRQAETEKVPYMLVVGDREADQGTVSVRRRGMVDGGAMPLEAFAAALQEEIRSRALVPGVGGPSPRA